MIYELKSIRNMKQGDSVLLNVAILWYQNGRQSVIKDFAKVWY